MRGGVLWTPLSPSSSPCLYPRIDFSTRPHVAWLPFGGPHRAFVLFHSRRRLVRHEPFDDEPFGDESRRLPLGARDLVSTPRARTPGATGADLPDVARADGATDRR